MNAAIIVFALIGMLVVAWFIVGPLLWSVLFATGKLIFEVRIAVADGKRPPWTRWLLAPKVWARGFWECFIGQSASEYSCGQMKWIPPFTYRGFGGREAKKEANDAREQ